MKLEEIEKPGELESSTIEYKERLNHDEPVGWLKTIAGFANADGGDFYIGVEDKTHKLIGFDRNEADKERNFFNNQINEHLTCLFKGERNNDEDLDENRSYGS